MTRTDFDRVFRPMCQALNVKITGTQADYFYAEFSKHDLRDFTHACHELAMGNPGYLPKLPFFRENIEAARGMRLEGEKSQAQAAITRLIKHGPKPNKDPNEDRWAKCCHALVCHDHTTSAAYVREQLADQSFLTWVGSWCTENGTVAKVWLEDQVAQRKGRHALNLAKGHI